MLKVIPRNKKLIYTHSFRFLNKGVFFLTDSETPSDLLRQIETHRSEQQNENLEAHIMTLPKEQTEKKKNFIQVISTTFQEPVRPQHQLEVKTDAAGVARSVELTVELPKVGSMSECQLTISKVGAR